VLAGPTFSKHLFGPWMNIGLGMLGALIGTFLFWLFRIAFGLGERKVTLDALISSFVGSML
jgi:uncharacterized membrane protein YeaQ/YmgE (transglycosylase-associated protein family)